jgi:hypothetical protein
MRKNIFYLLRMPIVAFIVMVFLFSAVYSQTINVKDYIKNKFPSIFSFYLSSLEALDPYEKEFIDLLEKLPEEEQEYYAKEVYKKGFSLEFLEKVKEGKTTPVPTATAKERIATHGFPKLYNQYQAGYPSGAKLIDMERLSLWDVITVDAESLATIEYLLGPSGVLRAANPNLVITVYFSAENSEPTDEGIFGRFNEGLQPNWLLRDVNSTLVKGFKFERGWSGYYNLPATGITEYFADFIQRELIETELFDGVFYDWGASSEFSWLNFRNEKYDGGRIDLNQDGVDETDQQIDSAMRSAMRNLHVKSREPRITINLVCRRQNPDNFALMRFTLASTLLFDGYFAFAGSEEPGGADYDSTWWYDEYSVNTQTGVAVEAPEYKGYLGEALGPAVNAVEPTEQLVDTLGIGFGLVDFTNKMAETKVWRRDFEHGIVLVNPTSTSETIDLGGTFRKIQGTRDPAFNDGSEVNTIVLPPMSGVILLRP